MSDAGVAFAIMCKAPQAGASKTRLCPPLTADEAAELSRCFITDVAAVIAGLPIAAGRVLVFTPAGAGPELRSLAPGFQLMAQRGDNLASRLMAATEDLFDAGYQHVYLLNSDSPTLPGSILGQAVAALSQPGDRVVLGPAIDGGYYLIGLKRAHAGLFHNIAWSTGQVLGQTMAAAAQLRLPVMLLPLWYDVDEPAALRLLLCELFGAEPFLTAGGSAADHTRHYLRQLLGDPGAERLGFTPPVEGDGGSSAQAGSQGRRRD